MVTASTTKEQVAIRKTFNALIAALVIDLVRTVLILGNYRQTYTIKMFRSLKYSTKLALISGILLAISILSISLFQTKWVRRSIFKGYHLSMSFLDSEDSHCLEQLKNAGVQFHRHFASPLQRQLGCYLYTGVELTKMEYDLVSLSKSHQLGQITLSCRTALALATFIRDKIAPSAIRILNKKLRLINHLGGYSCRYVAGDSQILSDHSFGQAFDIVSFEFEDGTILGVSDYLKAQGKEKLFLDSFVRDACAEFGTILSPTFDAAHQDHFHISQGLFSKCVF